MIDDRESDSHTHRCISSSRLIHSVEFFSHESDLILRDPSTIIGEYDLYGSWGFGVATAQGCSLASILHEVGEYIVEDLDKHITIHTDEHIMLWYDQYLLTLSLELWEVFMYEWSDFFAESKTLSLDIIRRVMRQMLILHDLFRDISQTGEFFLEESDSLIVECHHPIFYSFEIALHSGDRSTDLMWDIR